MPLPLQQLTLALFDEGKLEIADYVPGKDQFVLDAVLQWMSGDGPWYVMLWGATGTGKSHLIQCAIRAAGDRQERAMYLPLDQVMELHPAILEDLESIKYLGIDDIHLAAGRKDWELALFNLFNRIQALGGRLLVGSNRGPQNLELDLLDLSSRLDSGLICHLSDLDDSAKQTVLQHRAARRGINMPDKVARFLIHRLRRDMRELNEMFERIDSASLSAGRELTIPFVRDVLDLN